MNVDSERSSYTITKAPSAETRWGFLTTSLLENDMATSSLTAERARELLSYDPQSGLLTWRISRGNCFKAGDVAGPPGSMRQGYLRVYLDGRSYSVHRVIWLYVHRVHPSGEIDHIDGDRLNNKISNLRDVTRTKNQENLKHAHKDNSTGHLGVSYNKKNQKFTAHITILGRQNYLGSFQSAGDAHEAYLSKKRKHHSGCTI